MRHRTNHALALAGIAAIAGCTAAGIAAASDSDGLPGRRLDDVPFLSVARAQREARAEARNMLEPFVDDRERLTARVLWCRRHDDVNVDCKVQARAGRTRLQFVDELQLRPKADEVWWSGRGLRVSTHHARSTRG